MTATRVHPLAMLIPEEISAAAAAVRADGRFEDDSIFVHVRLREHGRNAQAVAEYLAKQKNVKRVYYPGLASHPGHDIAKRQQSGFGAIVTLEVNGGIDGAKRFSEALELFSLAESLGGVESLVAHPATMTHAAMAPEARAAAGLVDGLLRLSIGIESADDLLRDLANGVNSLR